MQSYDPYKLLTDVDALLRSHGLRPDAELGRLESGLSPVTAACELLRSLDVQPLRRAEDNFDGDASRHYDTRIHGD